VFSVGVASLFVMVVKYLSAPDPAHDDSSLRVPGNAREKWQARLEIWKRRTTGDGYPLATGLRLAAAT